MMKHARTLLIVVLTTFLIVSFTFAQSTQVVPYAITEFPVASVTHPHDVAPAPDGRVWYTAQHSGALGYLDPATGETRHIPLGAGSAPHGVIVGPDGAPWITDGGLNAIVRVDPETERRSEEHTSELQSLRQIVCRL